MVKIKHCLPFLLIFLSISLAQGQIGYKGIYKFVNLPPSSRTAALGGSVISVRDDDPTLAIQNPSLLNIKMNNQVALSYIDYLTDINMGSIVYAHSFDSINTISAGLHYINYGDFIKTDVTGQKLGTFSAEDLCFFAGWGRTWKRFSYGGQLKFISSQMESYKSNGLAVDVSGTYFNEKNNFTAALVFRNIGAQLSTYSGTREPLPFDIQTGISFKPKHMPIRFSVIAHDLQKWDLTYINTNKPKEKDLQTGQEIEQKTPYSEVIARHFIFGGEILVGKALKLQLGYNHQKRKELSLPDSRSLTGFSLGIGIKVSKFVFSYGRTVMHIAGGSNTFTFATNLSSFFPAGGKKDDMPVQQP